MKKVYTFSTAVLLTLAFTSCEKCSTCTTVSTDPETAGEILTEQVCDNGRDYTDLIEIYGRAGWDCTEN